MSNEKYPPESPSATSMKSLADVLREDSSETRRDSILRSLPQLVQQYGPSPDAVPAQIGHEAVLESQAHDGDVPRLPKIRMLLLAFGMMLTYFLGTASSTSATLLVPSIARDLGETELQTQWISSAYTLAFGCGLLFSGRLADIFGRKRLYIIGIVVYALFAILTGVIKSRLAMSVTRAVSGLGLAIASPAGFGIIGVNIRHEPARTIVFAAFGLGNPVGSAFGTLVGGAMASTGKNGWANLFFLLAGLAVVILVIACFVVPPDAVGRPTMTADRRIDWIGAVLVTAAICLFTFSLTESGIAEAGWKAPHVPAMLAVSIVLFALFATWSLHLERRTSFPPIIRMSLFTHARGRVTYTCACAFFISISVYGYVYATTIFYQNHKGYSALQNSISMLTCTIVGTGAASAVMYLAPRYHLPYLLCFGSAMTACSCILYAVIPDGIIFWAMEFPSQLLVPWGIDFVVGLGNILISNLINQSEQSVGGALFQTSVQIGASLGTCLSALLSSQIATQKASVLQGVRASFWFSTANAVLVVGIAFAGFRKVKLAKDVAKVI